jgi:SWI/SNF-related matrix-associated actin-dependent regulator 1 of chromatin subfamily A
VTKSPNLREYQREAVEFVRARRRSLVTLDPGLGKTAVSILAADLPALVVCPAGVRNHWRDEIAKWRPEAAGEFEVLSYHALSPSTANFAKTARTLIVDEAHYLKDPTTKRSRIGCSMLRAARRAIALTGTPVPNRPIELWPLMYAMRFTTLSYFDFAREFAGAFEGPHGLDVTGARYLRELNELLAPNMFRRTKDQVLTELPPKIWRVIALDLPVERQEKEWIEADLDLAKSVPFVALSDIRKLHGARKVPQVLDYVSGLLDGGERKVVVFAYHREVIASLEGGLRPFSPGVLIGGQSDAQRRAAVHRFQNVSSNRVLVAQTTAAGIGIDLTAARHVVFAEPDWVPANLIQAADRCHRITQKGGQVVADLLTIHRSLDEYMLRKALQKIEVIDEILAPAPQPEYRVGQGEPNLDPVTRSILWE